MVFPVRKTCLTEKFLYIFDLTFFGLEELRSCQYYRCFDKNQVINVITWGEARPRCGAGPWWHKAVLI